MEPTPHPELTVALALAAGILAQSVSRLLRLPGIVLLLACGALLGPEALGWIEPRSLGDGLFGIVDFGVAVILFEGGLNLEWSRLKRQEAAIRRLITRGALVTWVGAAVLASLALGWPLELAVLFGALVVVTGPTVIQPLLRDMRLPATGQDHPGGRGGPDRPGWRAAGRLSPTSGHCPAPDHLRVGDPGRCGQHRLRHRGRSGRRTPAGWRVALSAAGGA
jgi:hypothetical protein